MPLVRIPNTRPPRWSEVPEHLKWPVGRWRQAPAEYGGEWWYLQPFVTNNEEPWLTAAVKVEQRELPQGFVETFGPRPQGRDFPGFGGITHQEALIRWEQDLELFQGAQRDPRVTPQEWENAQKQCSLYGMGVMRPWKNKYGFWIRFPDSKIPWHEIDGISPQNDIGHEIGRYQVALALAGEELGAEPSPFFPHQFLELIRGEG